MSVTSPSSASLKRAATRRFHLDLSGPLILIVTLLLATLVVLPVSWIVVYSFRAPDGSFTLDNFANLFTDPTFVDPLVTTVIVACAVGVICLLVAAPMGWLVARTDLPFSRSFRGLVMASFVTPPFLGAVAWELLAAPNSGLLNKLYRTISGAEMGDYLFDIYTLSGLTFVIACYTFPYVFVLVANALDRIPGDLEDASAILGGRPTYTARRVTLPLAMPALLAGLLVAFLQSMTLFGSPAIIALPAGLQTLTTKIWGLFQFPPKPELAAAASLPLLLVTVLLLRGQAWILGRRGYTVVGGKNSDPRIVKLGWLRWPAFVLCLAVVMFPVFLPYAALLNAAFSPIATDLVTPQTLTLHNFYFTFFEISATQLALENTLILGVLSATAGTALTLIVSYATARKAVPGHKIIGFLATAPIAIPGIVLGVGLFLSYTRPPFQLYGTLWVLFIAYITIELPSAYQQLRAAFHAVHPELEEASRILGATRLGTIRRVTAPLLGSSVIATWCFIFVAVVRELSAAVILFTSQTKVVSVLIFDLKESGDFGAIAVLGLIMLVLTALVLFMANRVPGIAASARLRNN